MTVHRSVTLVGAGASTVITGSGDINISSPAIQVDDGRALSVKSLTIDGVNRYAQGIVTGAGKLTVTNSTIKHTGTGGAWSSH